MNNKIIILSILSLYLISCSGGFDEPPKLSPFGQATEFAQVETAKDAYDQICNSRVCSDPQDAHPIFTMTANVGEKVVSTLVEVNSDAVYESVYLFTKEGLAEISLPDLGNKMHPASDPDNIYVQGPINSEATMDPMLFFPGENIALTFYCDANGKCSGKWQALAFEVKSKEPTVICTDEDGGIEPEIKSTTELTVDGKLIETREDSCVKHDEIPCPLAECGLEEHYCELKDEDVVISSELIDCPGGCLDGVCSKEKLKPDLVAEQGLITEKIFVKRGEGLRISQSVTNSGKGEAASFDVGVYNGKELMEGQIVEGLGPSEGIELIFNNGFSENEPQGLKNLQIVVDDGNKVEETNELNNVRPYPVYVVDCLYSIDPEKNERKCNDANTGLFRCKLKADFTTEWGKLPDLCDFDEICESGKCVPEILEE